MSSTIINKRGWECSQCTLINKRTAKKCAVCRNKYTKNISKHSIEDDCKLAKEWQSIYDQRDTDSKPESLITTSKRNKKKRRISDMNSDEENEENDTSLVISLRKKPKIYGVNQESSKQKLMKDLFIHGFSPRKFTVKMAEQNSDEGDNTIRSRFINRLYKLHWKTNSTNKFIVKRKSQGKDSQIQSIQRFVNENGLGGINGLVEYKTKQSRYYKWRKPPLKTITLVNHRISSLNGQKGVIATKVIPKNTCISQYSGVEYSDDEWDKIYSDSNTWIKHRQYLCSSDINGYKITIDPMELSSEQHCIYMNDYRRNIFQSTFETLGDDEKYHNTDFCEVFVNGYPAIFVVSKREIQINEELCLYYGPKYGDIINQIRLKEELARYKLYEYNKIYDDDA